MHVHMQDDNDEKELNTLLSVFYIMSSKWGKAQREQHACFLQDVEHLSLIDRAARKMP